MFKFSLKYTGLTFVFWKQKIIGGFIFSRKYTLMVSCIVNMYLSRA